MVTCQNCGADNAVDHAFCASCGSSMDQACPSCGTANAPDNSFCFRCGTELAAAAASGQHSETSPTESSGERRLVSVVFADLVGFTTFSEQRDPEDVRGMLTAFYGKCREIIGRFGGTTDKFIGDAVMGVWGAVEAHEDDAERATRAALELVDMVEGLGAELGIPDLAARAGVLSGEASVGSGGNEHGLVVGDLVNTASRLQSIAPPGEVFVGESTQALASPVIEFEDAGNHEVKGKAEVVQAFRALRVVSLSTARRGGELSEGPFVGRDDELRLLKDQLHATQRDGRSRMVLLTGQGGIGKTRLSQELVRYIDGLTDTVYYHSGRSPSYGDGLTFWALGEMVRQRAGIQEGETAAKSRIKLRTAVADFVPDPDDQVWIEPRLAGLIGLEEIPSGEAAEFHSALRSFFQHVADRGSVLMVFEDLHWADQSLIEFVEELVDRSSRHPILVLSLARSELLDQYPRFGQRHGNTMSLPLRPLSEGSMVELLLGLTDEIDETDATLIAQRSGGVPLHAVEFVRMLISAGDEDVVVDELSIPDSISAVVGARLDRLPPREQTVVSHAAVLGVAFDPRLLGELLDMDESDLAESLAALVHTDVVEFDDDPRSPERGQYRFVQSLIREVAYGRLARSDRVDLHLSIAERFEAEGDVEVAGIVATHYKYAMESHPDNAELAERALSSVISAADRAASLHADRQARHLYEQAISMADDPRLRAELLQKAAICADAANQDDEALEMAVSALSIMEEAGDEEGTLDASVTLGSLYSGAFRSREAVDLLVPLYEEAAREASPRWAKLAGETARALALADEMEAAEQISNEVIPVSDELGLVAELLDQVINKGTAVTHGPRRIEGQILLRGVADAAKAFGLMDARTRALNNLVASMGTIDQRSFGDIQDLSDAADRIGNENWLLRRNVHVGTWMLGQGRLQEAIETYERTEVDGLSDVYRSIRDGTIATASLMKDGMTKDTAATMDDALAVLRGMNDPQIEAFVGMYAGAYAFSRGDFDEMARLGREVPVLEWLYPWALSWGVTAAGWTRDVELLEQVPDTLSFVQPADNVSRGLIGYARAFLAGHSGDSEEAQSEFERAETLWDEFGNPLFQCVMQCVFAKVVGRQSAAGEFALERAKEFLDTHEVGAITQTFAEVLGDASASSEAVAG